MRKPTIININSYGHLVSEIESIAHKVRDDLVVILRGANLDQKQQEEVTKLLGDVVGWYPNSSSNFKQKYEENHSKTDKTGTSGTDVVLLWHLEYVEYDPAIIWATWNMYKFECDPSVGKTYFVDSAELYEMLDSETKTFADGCDLEWYKVDGRGPYTTKLVQPHPVTEIPCIRLDITDTTGDVGESLLKSVNGALPTEDQRKAFANLRHWFIDQVYNNESIRYVHEWAQGDLAIPNMFRAVHAVTGGFDSSQREFTGLWTYKTEPKSDERIN